MDVDVAIVGAGFTGLATALFLAREHGIKAVVLEANQTAWGCTSRNGGQGQNASGRLYRSQWIERWGTSRAIRLNTDLAKKPPECLEYIVVHELAHLIEPSHNARFVSLMNLFMPKWQHYRDELNNLPVRHEDWDY